MCRSTLLSLSFFPPKNCHSSCGKQTCCIVPATQLLPTALPANPRPPCCPGKWDFGPGTEEKIWAELGLQTVLWQADVKRGQSRSQLFHLQPLLVSFHLPLDASPGSRGINKKSSFILRNGLAPSYIELKAPRLKCWQRREQGGVPRRDLRASLSSQPTSPPTVGTERGHWILVLVPSCHALERTL